MSDRTSAKPPRKKLRDRLAEGDTYGTLLILIVVAYVVMAVIEDSKWSRTIVGVCFGATLILAPHVHVRAHHPRRVGDRGHARGVAGRAGHDRS